MCSERHPRETARSYCRRIELENRYHDSRGAALHDDEERSNVPEMAQAEDRLNREHRMLEE